MDRCEYTRSIEQGSTQQGDVANTLHALIAVRILGLHLPDVDIEWGFRSIRVEGVSNRCDSIANEEHQAPTVVHLVPIQIRIDPFTIGTKDP